MESTAVFASLFCDYIAEHYAIVPDEFTSETPASQSTPRGGVGIPRQGGSGLIVEQPGTVVEVETMRPLSR